MVERFGIRWFLPVEPPYYEERLKELCNDIIFHENEKEN